MGELSRRRLLVTGGALGIVGALGVPARAWSWSPRGSIAGLGEGLAPWTVWDDLADPVIADVIERGEVPAVNAILRDWTHNGQPLPSGLPSDLHAFIESARQLPAWTDPAKLDAGFAFNQKRGTYLGVLYGMASGMMSTVIPHEARAVYYSKGGADMKRRISRTAKLGYDIGTRNAFDADGTMIVTSVKTRMVHAAVRHLLPQSPSWNTEADEEVPISQRDLLVTWHSLSPTIMRKMDEWGITHDPTESEGYLHTWQVTAHMLGVKDEYIPATWDDAHEQTPQVLDPVLAPTREGVELADILLDLGSDGDAGLASRPFLEAWTRYTLGDEIADGLEIQRRPLLQSWIALNWPNFVRFKEATTPLPLAPQGYWTFDEFLRRGTLHYLSEGQPIHIEIPDGNNPNH